MRERINSLKTATENHQPELQRAARRRTISNTQRMLTKAKKIVQRKLIEKYYYPPFQFHCHNIQQD